MIENEKIKNAQARINACKSLLANSDYQIIKIAEGMVSCTSMAELLAWFSSAVSDCGELIKKRKQWREDINAAEAVIAAEEDIDSAG